MAGNCPNLAKKRHKHTDSRTEQTPTSISISKSMSRHIINKLMATKDKEKNRKDNQREKNTLPHACKGCQFERQPVSHLKPWRS